MAQLKDSLITGDLRVTGTIYGDANLSSLNASGTGLGTNGQILKTTGSGLAWVNAADTHNHDSRYVNVTGDTMTGTLISQSGGIWVQGGSAAGSNSQRMTFTSGMPTEFKYNNNKRGVYIYSNGIALADPYNGNSNNDAGWIRHIEETANTGTLEIGVGDDNANECVAVRRYNTSGEIGKYFNLIDASGNAEFNGGILKVTNNSNTLSIGSQNISFTHIYNSADIPFIFNKDVLVTGKQSLGNTTYPFGKLQLGKADNGIDGIYFQGTKANHRMIRMIDNTSDNSGNGISIGGGGLTVIGSGEYSDNLISAKSLTGEDETTYIGSDGSVFIEGGGQTVANRIGIQITTSGNILPVKAEEGNNNAQTIGSSSHKWKNIYATTFNGDLSGTATNANNLLQNTRMDYGWNGLNYFNIIAANQSKAKVNDTPSSSATWWHILRFNHGNNAGYYTDLAIPFNANNLYYKRIANGTLQNSTINGGWVKIFDELQTIPVTNGGTGVTTLTAHGLLVGNGTSDISAISPVAAGQVLVSNGTSANPKWFTPTRTAGSTTSVVNASYANEILTLTPVTVKNGDCTYNFK